MNIDKLLAEMSSLWNQPRATTLARIATHHRQFESWWKWELATHLWDYAQSWGGEVFVEENDRADLTLGYSIGRQPMESLDLSGAICVPIELKTTGTWWGTTPGAIRKALAEPNKCRLTDDLHVLSQGIRPSNPAGLCALLITDSGGAGQALDDYSNEASKMALYLGLKEERREDIVLPSLGTYGSPRCRQLVWSNRTSVQSSYRCD